MTANTMLSNDTPPPNLATNEKNNEDCSAMIENYIEITSWSPRSRSTRLRAHLEERKRLIEKALKTARDNTEIFIDPHRTTNGKERVKHEHLIRCAALDASRQMRDVLADVARRNGTSENEIERLKEPWRREAFRDTMEWIRKKARISNWERIIKTLRSMGDLATRKIRLERWALLAGEGTELVKKMNAVAPWTAVEACHTLDQETLRGNASLWNQKIVKEYARRAGREDRLTDEDAENALIDWRWPGVRPPLGIIGGSAGMMHPIQGDSAWASALDNNQKAEGLSKYGPQWARGYRINEDEAYKKTIECVERLAQQWIVARTKKSNDAQRTLERWKDEWRENEKLAGNGTTMRSALKAHATTLGWKIMIEDPSTLLARCLISGEWPSQIMDKTCSKHATLRMSVHTERYRGWEVGGGTEAKPDLGKPTGLGTPMDEIATLERLSV